AIRAPRPRRGARPTLSPPRSLTMAKRLLSFRDLRITSVASLALVLAAAGCGGSGHAAGPRAGGGGTTAGTSAVTQGVITAFGTIHMGSGSHEKVFEVDDAVLKRLDDGVTHDRTGDDVVVFRVGMKVEVFHDADSTRASEVRFMDDIEGPITAKPSA